MEEAGWRRSIADTAPEPDEARLLTEMAEIRSQIDGLDNVLSRLLAERLALARQLSGLKSKLGLPIQDSGREADVLNRVSQSSADASLANAVRAVYGSVIEQSRALQFSGTPGRKAPLYFPRICIIGLGLIGGALARQIKKKIPTTVTVGVDKPEVLAEALRQGLIDSGESEATIALHKAQLVILAASPRNNLRLLETIAPHLNRRQLILDVTSTKQAICQLAERLNLRGADFIGGHPLFGSEKSGLANSGEVLAEGKAFCLVPTARSSELALRRLSRWLATLDFKIEVTDATTHDITVGRLSHLVQLLAVLLGAEIAEGRSDHELQRLLRLAGPSFSRLSRLMDSPPELWTEIIAQNSRAVEALLRSLDCRIQFLADSIQSGDGRAIQDAFIQASRIPKNTC